MSRSITAGLRKFVAPPDLALDLGTANTRLYAVGHGLIADEPSMIHVQPETGAVEAVGARAAWLACHDPYANSVSPLHAGVVVDVEAATSLLKPFLQRAQRLGFFKPRALACAPTDACKEEREALIEATRRAGASAVVVVPEPLAAAIGAGLDIASPYAQMLVDIGDGVTDIAVWRGTDTNWYILQSSDEQTTIVSWGSAAQPYKDIPTPADYDGDGVPCAQDPCQFDGPAPPSLPGTVGPSTEITVSNANAKPK